MSNTDRCVECTACGAPIKKEEIKKISPCPYCGCTRRNVRLKYSENLYIHEKIKLKATIPGTKKEVFESIGGEDFSFSLNKFVNKTRVIDRINNRYKEEVIDPDTNEVLHKSDEPLSDHTGHGEDKR